MVPALQDGWGFHPGAGAFSAVSAEHTPSPVVVTPVKRGNNVRRFTELPCGGLQGTRQARAGEPSGADSGKADCYHPLKSLLSPPPLRTSWALSSHSVYSYFLLFLSFPVNLKFL